MSDIVRDWSDLPLTLRMADVAAIYSLSLKTVRRCIERNDPSVPRPNFLNPYRWRRQDVRQHYDRITLEEQRRARAIAQRDKLQRVG